MFNFFKKNRTNKRTEFKPTPYVPTKRVPKKYVPKKTTTSTTHVEQNTSMFRDEEIAPEVLNISEQQPKERVDHKKEFLRIFRELTYRHRAWDIWRDFITMFACSLSNAVDKTNYDEREAMYMRIIKKYEKKEQLIFQKLVAETVLALEDNQEQDFLGDIFMSLDLGNDSNGQFFTPYCVCRIMAEITVGDFSVEVEEKGYIAINDPCCGAGATLIAGIHEARKQLEKKGLNYQNHVLVVAQDIDFTVALMCYIQLSLLGVAAYIKIGNTFTEPMCSSDKLDNYWFTMMYFSEVWMIRRILRNKTLL